MGAIYDKVLDMGKSVILNFYYKRCNLKCFSSSDEYIIDTYHIFSFICYNPLTIFCYHTVFLHHAVRRNKYRVVKNLLCFVMLYYFYSTRCVLSIPSRKLGDRKHTTRWIKMIQKMGDPIFIYSVNTKKGCMI
jgi:hypothetical protein